MEVAPALQIFAFALFAVIAVAGALGMATTMSMFRSGLFLMASFMGVGGLFILLMADLLGMLQIMMYIGGMLVMILFMVLFSQDPGGEMMMQMMKQGSMKMSAFEMFFSRGIISDQNGRGQKHEEHASNQKQDLRGEHSEAGHNSKEHKQMQHQHAQHEDGGQKSMQHAHRSTGDMKMDGMSMDDMNMFTPIKKQAAVLACIVGALLIALILLRPSWPVVSQLPDQNSPAQVGTLLMGKYMIAFEGCGLLILLGIFASVMISRPATHPDARDREHLRAAVEEAPAPVEPDPVVPASPVSESEGENG